MTVKQVVNDKGAFYLKVDEESKKVVELNKNPKYIFEEYYRIIQISLVDHISFEDEERNIILEFIIDEEGLLKSGNPVFKVEIQMHGETINFLIYGAFLIGRTYYSTEGYAFTGFYDAETVNEVLVQYQIEVFYIGKIR
ncbi:hypothetical protein ACQKEY_22610 [Lysinibacillus fusiformis]|uniref:hypothetical protein n=1 Tax=Lysinibacillus fusiformis TaxID=28031 RepID=UPI002E1A7917|nr:hypothetical protein [Lysinibacillus fusiformis]